MTCPRCLGTGFVDKGDIVRLDMKKNWAPGSCRYCNATGKVKTGLPKTKRVDDPKDVHK